MPSKASWYQEVCQFWNSAFEFARTLIIVTICGLVFGAENALLAHEAERRREENNIRREARYDLARRGLIATETEIAKWKEARTRSIDS